MRQIHRQLVTSGKSEDAANVISMFVRHHNRVQVGRRSTQPCQPRRCRSCRETAVEQYLRLAGIDNQGIALTAAA
jgi:hypothetical protein